MKFKRWKQEKGQGMTEYVIILALVAVAAIKVVQVFGGTVKIMYGRVSAKLQDKTYHGEKYGDLTSIDQATKDRSLGDFDD